MAAETPPTPPGGRPGAAERVDRRDAAVATTDDLRGLRRWVLVAGVWAVAATAVALIALLDSSDDDAERRAGEAAGGVSQLREVQRELEGRIEGLESQLEDVPQAADVARLQTRLRRAEDTGSGADDRARNANERAAELEDRVGQLEDDVAAQNGSGGAGGGGDTDAEADQP